MRRNVNDYKTPTGCSAEVQLIRKKNQKERKYLAFLLNHFGTQVKMSLLWKACHCSEKLEAQF